MNNGDGDGQFVIDKLFLTHEQFTVLGARCDIYHLVLESISLKLLRKR